MTILHHDWFLMIDYIVCDSLNTELLSVKANKSVFQRILFAPNDILLICLEAIRSDLLWPNCLRIVVLNAELPLYRIFYCCALEFLLRQQWEFPNLSLLMICGTSSKSGISTESGILSQLCSIIFTITIMNEICWSLRFCDGCCKLILMKMISKC